jgi:immune inhibitor A
MKDKNILLVGIVLLVVILCCLCLIVGVIGYSFFQVTSITTSGISTIVVTMESPGLEVPSLPMVSTPTPLELDDLLSPTATEVDEDELVLEPTRRPTTSGEMDDIYETLAILDDTIVPINDLLDLGARLNGKLNIPRTLPPPNQPYQVGDERDFWVTNVDDNQNFQISARLEYQTEHAYFWVQDGVRFDDQELEALAEAFENDIYPTNREFFGSEWTPGVDNDPRLYILYARDLGFNLAGYFSSADEYHPEAHEYSNAVEMFLLNSDNIGLGEAFTYGVLAHEFQHMIHWYQDRNESSWLNEGFSELAAFLNGYYESGFDWLYMQDTDLQLNNWPNDPDSTTPHYGAGFLFVTYFLDRFGSEVTQSLVGHDENGLTSVDLVLEEFNITDPQNGQLVTADQFFLDWVVTNLLQDDRVGDGRYDYQSYQNPPNVVLTEEYEDCPVGEQERSVSQYGVDYIRFTCDGSFKLRFSGVPTVGVLPESAYSGKKMFWSNQGDESNMTLTQTFDFSEWTGPITLSYWTWYDLEKDYDYVYLVASTDGVTWDILETPSGTDFDPSGNSYGWGYNGTSGGLRGGEWIQEEVDISQFAGQTVQLRFEYVTDAAVNGEGFLLDDIAVPELGYFSDFENDDGGWEAAGWARISNLLPQTYRLALVTLGDKTEVRYLDLAEDMSLEIPLEIGGEVDEAILVVTGTTRYTRQKASYRYEVFP